MSKYDKEVKEVKEFADNFIADVTKYFQDVHGVKEFKISTTFTTRNIRSTGGTKNFKPFIKISLHNYILAAQAGVNTFFREYDSIQHDSQIGTLLDVNWKKALAAMIVHEIAHAAQFFSGTKSKMKVEFNATQIDNADKRLLGHGWFWQAIYRDLRNKFVNNMDFVVDNTNSLVEMASRTAKIIDTPKTIEAPKAKRNNGKITTKYSPLKGHGKLIEYFNEFNELIGTLNKPHIANSEVRWFDYATKTWHKTGTTDVREARKAYFGI